MGLDTSHDCWHGPYSAFMHWRAVLHVVLDTGAFISEIRDASRRNERWTDRDSLKAAWTRGHYADQSVAINVLMNHSDCDGHITHADCLPLAEALEELVPRFGSDSWAIEKTRRFAEGLRRAHETGEDVDFH